MKIAQGKRIYTGTSISTLAIRIRLEVKGKNS
jgi:hypothetical protein